MIKKVKLLLSTSNYKFDPFLIPIKNQDTFNRIYSSPKHVSVSANENASFAA